MFGGLFLCNGVLVVGVLLVIVMGIVYGLNWWIVGCFVEIINNVYVCGEIILISLCVFGYVIEFLVFDNERVE